MLDYNKEQLAAVHKTALEKLVALGDGRAYLSRMLGLPLGTINSWIDRGRISKDGARLVESHKYLGKFIKAKELRPDITNY